MLLREITRWNNLCAWLSTTSFKAHWRLELELHTFLTSAPDGGVISFTPLQLLPWRKMPPVSFGQLCRRIRMSRRENLPEIQPLSRWSFSPQHSHYTDRAIGFRFRELIVDWATEEHCAVRTVSRVLLRFNCRAFAMASVEPYSRTWHH